ncbi:uncharacterized protein LOC124944930 [Impatiens glandulifera]|uniref:uncharacterized protein LOC124944930 n=1 Tax=Impatiens glandulifera TaxID=253017 RepID=UPI001FB0D778|nr:uncharacterized protein LOC124944930 [Impatiens glandulifera]
MATYRNSKNKSKPRSSILILTISITVISFLYIVSTFLSTKVKNTLVKSSVVYERPYNSSEKYLYWGNRIDCPGKHCGSCEGLGHQESSLRCALEEAMFLGRTFVMPSRMCINPIHNKKGILHRSEDSSADEMWDAGSCAMDSLYDLELISETVPVILDNSKAWHYVMSTSMKLGNRGVAHVEGISRVDLKEKSQYANILLINRTASPLSWFMECKDRNNHSAVLLPYSFLPSMASNRLQVAAKQIQAHLGDYDAIHVRRGDKLKTRKDRFGIERSLHPHLDRDTRPQFILCRISKWVPPGRTLFIASNERTPGFFSPLAKRYKLAYSSNYSKILDPLIGNNYELFMIERLVMMRGKTWTRTFKEDDKDLALTDDPKKNTKIWDIPVYKGEGDQIEGC